MDEKTVAELDEELNVQLAVMDSRTRTLKRRLLNQENSEDTIRTYIDVVQRVNEILGEIK